MYIPDYEKNNGKGKKIKSRRKMNKIKKRKEKKRNNFTS
jgi:hypothetical protein